MSKKNKGNKKPSLEKKAIHFDLPVQKYQPGSPSGENEKTDDIPAELKLRLKKDNGIFFGKREIDYHYRHIDLEFPGYVGKPQDIDGHCAVFGSSGSGKGSCIAVPTMVSWGDSPMIVLDPKGDLSNYYLKMSMPAKRPAKIFNPSKENTCTYDPFSHIKSDDETNLVSNVRELVNAIIPKPLASRDRFWIAAAQKILTGALLYYLGLADDDIDPENQMTFYTAIDCITSISIEELFEKINRSDNEAAKKYIRSFTGKDDLADSEMLMDINETLDTYLMEFVNDVHIKKALTPSENSINWEKDLDKYQIFLSIPEDRIEQWGSLLNVMVTQLIRTLQRRPEQYSPQGENLKPLLLLLDEFPMIGRIDVLTNALSMLRSKKVTMLLIAQSIAQLSAIYGHDVRNIMLENCDFQAVLRVNCVDSQKYFSELAGTVLKLTLSVSEQYDLNGELSSHSEGFSETDKPLIRPEDLAHLDKDLILFTPYRTFRVKKYPFFNWKPGIFTPLPNLQDLEESDKPQKKANDLTGSQRVKAGPFTYYLSSEE